MSGYRLSTRKPVRHHDPNRLVFSVLTEEEILKLSVAKIDKTDPFGIDRLNHPIKGGLYDPALGPLEENSLPCGTCGHGLMKCMGHFGHIELPVTVVNPLFHKMLFTVLKLSCRECFTFQIPNHLKMILFAKLKLLEEGFFTDVRDLEQEVLSSLPKNPGQEVLSYVQDIIDSYFQNLHNRERFKTSNSTPENSSNLNARNGNMETQTHVDEILKDTKPRKICINCQLPIPKLTFLANRIMTPEATNKTAFRVDSQNVVRRHTMVPILPKKSKTFLRMLWANEKEMMKVIVPVLRSVKSEYPSDIFFCDVLPVTPPIVRPISMLNGEKVTHPRTVVYTVILQNCSTIKETEKALKYFPNENQANDDEISRKAKKDKEQEKKDTEERQKLKEKLYNTWHALQVNINHLMDREMNKTKDSATCLGLKQIIEKKAGVIRMHMMGKRVNYAARSVITPDPNLDIDEIGIPEAFALKLTYPVPVTPWNVTEIRRMVLNGPNVHPGAVLIENEDGFVKRISGESLTQRESIAKTLLTKSARANSFLDGPKIVHRHLQNGDMLLLNRQPTLHKPSIMAHRARILKGEKTIRLHYANCKAYNADFDGDEMNAHFPQNELARSEATLIANASNQYLVPKDGTPLCGLIQDHIISGVRLTMRGRFFEKEDYQHLVFAALWSVQGDLILLPPAIIKPKKLWSGKQVLSTVLMNLIPKGRPKINLTGRSKIGIKEWTIVEPRKPKCGIPFKDPVTMSEVEVVVRNGELLCGVLDKAHYGATAFGLIHCIYELYGGNCATKMLSAFGKVFQAFLMTIGFTLGVKDIVLTKPAERKRKKILKKCRKIGEGIQRSVLELPEDTPMSEVTKRIEKEYATDRNFRAKIDREYKTVLDDVTNEINKVCLPSGLVQKFPDNNLQLMVQSGAKGSSVNTMQISCLLGQIELEGRRPPLMISGRSLPSFPPFDPSPRAGGFVGSRFMTGLDPQEFFFHCMAGREGLIDTAVKTSRSGYLQRCLIKHLEGVTTEYDGTIRDSDGSVIQYNYGEDGLDVCGSQFLNIDQINFLLQNKDAIVDQDLLNKLKTECSDRKVSKHVKKIKKWESKHGSSLAKRRTSPFTAFSAENFNPNSSKRSEIDPGSGRSKSSLSLMRKWIRADEEVKKSFQEKTARCPDPVMSQHRPDLKFGVLTEKMEKMMAEYMEQRSRNGEVNKEELKDLIGIKVIKALCPPGESVGILAAQSIGEPSTQMTLNTFHFAGRGEMNVTLGIPRLREILMMASKKIKTPSMEIPFRKDIPKFTKQVDEVCRKLTRCTLPDVLEDIDVSGEFVYKPNREIIYTIRLNCLHKKFYKHEFHTSSTEIIAKIETCFFKEMFKEIKKLGRATGDLIYIDDDKKKDQVENSRLDEDEGENSQANAGEMHESSDDEQVEDADASTARSWSRHQENQEYDDPEEEEIEFAAEEKEDEPPIEGNFNSSLNVSSEEINGENSPLDSGNYRSSDRKLKVKNAYPQAIEYDFDEQKEEWCSLIFRLPIKMFKLDLQSIIKRAASRVVLWETPNIKRAFTFQNSEGETILKTEGINIIEMFKYNEILHLEKLYSNDIYGISQSYGIEAANRVIIKEVKDVFKMYGITVDLRHLTLIADYMTFDGSFQPMSRKGMEHSASPLQQMSFESSMEFLKKATIQGKSDDLRNPSSRLMVGKPGRFGSGAMDIFLDLRPFLKAQSGKPNSVW